MGANRERLERAMRAAFEAGIQIAGEDQTRIEKAKVEQQHELRTRRRHDGCCEFCGRALEDPESLRRGYGPDCAAKQGLPWGS